MAVELWTNDAGCDLPCHYSVKRRIFQAFRPKKGRFSKCLSCGKAVDRNCGQVWKKRGDVERMWEKKTGRRERFRKKRKERGGRERLSTQISTMWIKLSPDIHLSTGKRVWRKQVFFHGKQEKIAGGRQRRGDFIRRTLEKREKVCYNEGMDHRPDINRRRRFSRSTGKCSPRSAACSSNTTDAII